MTLEILIVGGGLSGLALAARLEESRISYRLVEARAGYGGRVLSLETSDGGARLDLGPAWFWPGQRRMKALAEALGAQIFRQYATGSTVVEASDGAVQRDYGVAVHPDAYRIDGGAARLIEELVARIPAKRRQVATEVVNLERRGDGWRAHVLANGAREAIDARTIMLTAPPRVVLSTIAFDPDAVEENARDSLRRALAAVPTWMAGSAKAAVVYDRPFWREDGLSGDGLSRRGPLVQIHDASPADGGGGALFGFIGYAAAARAQLGDVRLKEMVAEQLETLFGPRAANPTEIHIKDWASERFTTTAEDLAGSAGRPFFRRTPEISRLEAMGLYFAGTETAREHGGLLEGALEAAEQAFHRLTADRPNLRLSAPFPEERVAFLRAGSPLR